MFPPTAPKGVAKLWSVGEGDRTNCTPVILTGVLPRKLRRLSETAAVPFVVGIEPEPPNLIKKNVCYEYFLINMVAYIIAFGETQSAQILD